MSGECVVEGWHPDALIGVTGKWEYGPVTCESVRLNGRTPER